MFNKILENIKYQSDYRHKLASFINSENKERRIRKLGLFIIILAFLIQMIALVNPAKSSAASSPNDLITGGVTSKQQLVDYCNSDYHYVGLIYGWYGVTCANIADASSSVITLNSTSYNGSLWSVGHLPYGLPSETPVTVWGATLYWRMLHAWDTNGSSNYTALKVTAKNGSTFFILFGCGNLVSIGFPTPYTTPVPTPTPTPTPVPVPVPVPVPTPKPTPCPYNPLLTIKDAACRPCDKSQSFSDSTNCLKYSKSATNMTQGINDANNSKANPGDIISYKLSVQNIGKLAVKSFVIQENISDVLDYANVGNLNGGVLNLQTGVVAWPAINIPANGTVSESFTVTVKNPVPNTAPGKDDPSAYNYIMTNVYGNTININVNPPPTAVVAQAAVTSLPNTGPGSNLLIIFIVTSLAGYFYYRSKLLSKEAEILEDITGGEA